MPVTSSPLLVRRLALGAVIGYALLVVSGGAVRLSGSGLGCPDWPTCFAHHLTAESSIYSRVEFGNRLVGIAVTVVVIVLFLATLVRTPRRRDLVGYSAVLVGGILIQIVIGGLVVLFKLNPYLVSLHFLLTIAILGVAIVCYHRASSPQTQAVALLDGPVVWLSRIVLVVLSALLAVGTVVTGSGPHAGGVGAKRYPIAFRAIAEGHSTLALFLIGMSLALTFALAQIHAPHELQRRAQRFVEILFIQGILGYTQYALHDSALVVEFHLAGATSAWCACVWYYLALHTHPSEQRSPSREVVGATA